MERYLLVVVAGTVGGLLAQRCHIPGGAVVGAMLFSGITVLFLPKGIVLPSSVGTGIQIILGITLGVTVDRSLLTLGVKIFPLAILSTIILLAVAVCMAFLASKLGLVDFGTALFGFSPGGMTGMAILAQSENHNGSFVAFFHLVRIFTLFLVIPLLVKVVMYLQHKGYL
ncbi:AbrB family transcriptional regulator [Desulfobacter vibrioformis]|uniref:AbrB family transcriptional regulator n=1 Tax=Desulfobacter vibrioformis TaxID=34031 RepID=UPI000550460A|nr:AbrB family transcriptional regulator [Desulfobacter vibrioformis]